MHKPKLLLPTGYQRQKKGWNWTLFKMIASSKVFDVKECDFPYARADGARNANWTTMQVNDIRIGLDTWDTFSPTSHFKDVGHFNKTNGILKDIDIIIKIQHYPCKFWDDFEKDTGIKVTGWTVMPTKDFPLGAFQWENKSHKWVTTVTGKNSRFGRQPWTDWCANQDDFFSSGAYLVNDTLESYVERLKSCKWGMILKGKNGAEKNRRECEFTSCGIPLALNYDPYYPWGMIPDTHYVRLHRPEDLAKLRDINPEPYAKASRQLYFDRFSPYGMANTLLELVEKL